MGGNSIGKILVLTTFGESHGIATGGVLDGFPPAIPIDPGYIQTEMDRRRPGFSPGSTPRREEDSVEILSGLFHGRSTGAPIAFLIRNKDTRSSDYEPLRDIFRPSHADFTWQTKYGIRDYRGGGRASARETAARVAAGAIVKQFLMIHGISISSRIISIGPHHLPEGSEIYDDPVITTFLSELKAEGNTAGGIVSLSVAGVPPGLGEPVFDKLEADLSKAMMSIPAVKGFESGSGFEGTRMKGSEQNDRFILKNGRIITQTNHSGGIQGGISNGMEITCRVAFKPVSTLAMEQQSVNHQGEEVTYLAGGRHDVCVIPRALPIVEAMAAMVIGDHLVRNLSKDRLPR